MEVVERQAIVLVGGVDVGAVVVPKCKFGYARLHGQAATNGAKRRTRIRKFPLIIHSHEVKPGIYHVISMTLAGIYYGSPRGVDAASEVVLGLFGQIPIEIAGTITFLAQRRSIKSLAEHDIVFDDNRTTASSFALRAFGKLGRHSEVRLN